MVMRLGSSALARNTALFLSAFVALSLMLVTRPDRAPNNFDGSFYVTIAYDLDRYGVFSNGIFGEVDSVVERPRPGMFFGPVFPLVVYAAIKLDPRFAEAVRCSVESDRQHRDQSTCESYALPLRLCNALFLAIGVTALACAAQLLFRQRSVYLLVALLALWALWEESNILCLVMTESLIFGLYGLLTWVVLRAWSANRIWHFASGGALLGILCLTKPSFLALLPVLVATSLLYRYRIARLPLTKIASHLVVFALAFGCVLAGWAARNLASIGKFALTEEYGSAALIERFAYDDMTAREFFQAFPYCTPGIGDLAFDLVYGTDSMHRFVYHTPASFFHVGRDRRDEVFQQNARLDPLIGAIIRDEMRTNWWRYLVVTIPLAWCGMWAGAYASLLLVPLFAWALLRAVRTREMLFLLYVLPAIVLLALHAAVGNHTTRYNYLLIGPYAIGAAWIISLNCSAWQDARWRSQSRAPAL